jgi:hypothetical protein
MQHVWRPCGATMRAARALQLAVEHVSVWGLSLCYDAAPTLIVAVVAGCVRASCASYPAKLEWACCDVPLAAVCRCFPAKDSQLCTEGQRRGCALLLGMQHASFRTSMSANLCHGRLPLLLAHVNISILKHWQPACVLKEARDHELKSWNIWCLSWCLARARSAEQLGLRITGLKSGVRVSKGGH